MTHDILISIIPQKYALNRMFRMGGKLEHMRSKMGESFSVWQFLGEGVCNSVLCALRDENVNLHEPSQMISIVSFIHAETEAK